MLYALERIGKQQKQSGNRRVVKFIFQNRRYQHQLLNNFEPKIRNKTLNPNAPKNRKNPPSNMDLFLAILLEN